MLRELLSEDQKITAKIRIKNTDSFAFRAAAIIAHSGDSWLICGFLLVFWLFSNGEREELLAFWGITIAFTAVVIFFLKKLIRRERPDGDWGAIYRKGDPHSFPSGHAVRSGVIIVLACFFLPSVPAFFICLWMLAIAVSRVLTGVHYILDVAAGLVIGIAFGKLFILFRPVLFPPIAQLSSWVKSLILFLEIK